MKVLFLGYSRIARRRVLPALRRADPDALIAVASRSATPADRAGGVEWYDDYPDALNRSGADAVYISLHNSAHEEWIESALDRGLHVIVDKPACLSNQAAQRFVRLAKSRGRLFAEAIVFSYHPQFALLEGVLSQTPESRPRVTALFSFPALPATDFRYRRELGGGAIWDLGPYVAATSRLVFRREPVELHATIVDRMPDGLITAFAILASYGTHGSFVGQFGFGTVYNNRLSVVTPTCALHYDRAYTTDPASPSVVRRQTGAATETIEVPPTDSFEAFWRQIIAVLPAGHNGSLAAALAADAQLLSSLRRVLGDA
jgi:predicted dehydrogenase